MMTILSRRSHGGQLERRHRQGADRGAALGAPVHILVAGPGTKRRAEPAAKLAGVEKVLTAGRRRFAHGLAEPLADLIVALAARL